MGKDIYFTSRGLRLHGRFYEAQQAVKGNFLLLHGLTSNSLWFEKIAKSLSAAGYNVLSYDRRGSGRSDGVRGDVPSEEAFFWDMQAAFDYLRSQSDFSTHVIAFSYSWKLPPLYVSKVDSSSKEIESMIFVAPASDLRDGIRPTLKDKLKVFFNIQGPYYESPVKESHLTKDPETLKWIHDSGKSRLQALFTRRFLMASNALDQQASRAIPGVHKPMLVLLPKQDQVIDALKIKRRFSEGPYGVARKVMEIDGSHIIDSASAQEQLVSTVLSWASGPKLTSYC